MSAVNGFLGLPKPIQEAGVAMLGISAAGLLATSGLLKVKTTVAGAMEALRDMGPMGERAAGALGKIGKVAGTLTLVGAAALVGFEGMSAFLGYMDSKSAPVKRDIDALTSSLSLFASTTIVTGELAKAFGTDLSKLGHDIAVATAKAGRLGQELGAPDAAKGIAAANAARGDNSKASRQATGDIKDLDSALSSLAANGGATQAKMAMDKLTASLVAQGVPLAQINAMFPQYAKAAVDAAAASTSAAQGFGDVTANAATMDKGLQDAIDHGETLASVFKQLNGAALDLMGATIDEKQALADLTDKWDKHGNALNLDTQAGRDNQTMIDKAIAGAAAAAQAKYNETGSVQAATDTYNTYITALRTTLHNLGVNDDLINQLINDYAQMPPAVTTTVHSYGLNDALNSARGLMSTLENIDGKTVSFNVRMGQDFAHVPAANMKRWGGVTEHAQAGLLRDAGVYSAVSSGARYAFAEPATKGEAFIPRSGNISRSRAIADYVVGNWLGGQTSWGTGGGGGASGGPSTLQLAATFVLPSGEVVHKQLVTYALNTGRSPGQLFPANSR
jgi:hypothetical protein